MFWKNNLTARLVVYFLSLSLLTVIILGVIGYRGARAALSDAAVDRLEVAAELSEDAIEHWVADQRDAVLMLAARQSLRQNFAVITGDDTHSDSARRAYRQLHTLVRDVLVIKNSWQDLLLLDQSGRVQVASATGAENANHILERFFVRGQKSTFVQPVYPARGTGEPTMTIATPVADESGRPLGVLAVHLDLARMDRVLEQQRLHDGSESYLVDGYNVFVSARRFGRGARPQGTHSLGIDAAVRGRDGAALYDNYNGVPVVGAYRWLDDLRLAVLVELPQERAFAPAFKLAWILVGVGLLIALVLALATMLVARQITRPLVQLTNAAVQVADGDLSVEVPCITDDERGLLASTFNRMTHKLQRVYDDLEGEIRERRQVEQDLIEAKEQAEQATAAKSAFLAHMSHELRTPMNGIVGVLQLMQSSPMTPEQEEYTRIGQTSASALLTVINDILDFSKIEAGKLELERIPFDLSASAFEVRDILGRQADEKDVALLIEQRGDVPEAVMGDPNRLRQILLNLVSNAIKFTERGSVTLRQTARTLSDGRTAILFEVEDTGIGMSEPQIAALFQPFTQADSSTTRRFGGTGLGLAIVKRLVAAMGSDIHVTSRVGRGTRFWFTAEFTRATPTSPNLRTGSQPGRSAPDPNISGRPTRPSTGRPTPTATRAATDRGEPHARILVVDDNAVNRKITSHMLALLGRECDTVDNGAQAVERVSARAYDLVLMDCQMPEMDGYQATRLIRERERHGQRHTPIVAMTASAMKADREHCLAAGMDDYLSKPISKDQLRAIVARYLPADAPAPAPPATAEAPRRPSPVPG